MMSGWKKKVEKEMKNESDDDDNGDVIWAIRQKSC